MRTLLILLLSSVVGFGQVNLPHRHAISSLIDTNPPFQNMLIYWLWAKTFDGLADGTQVTNWWDLSGHTNYFTQATAAKRPTTLTNQINGFPAVYFNRTNTHFVSAYNNPYDSWWGTRTQYQVFYVVKCAITTDTLGLDNYCNVGAQPFWYPKQDGTIWDGFFQTTSLNNDIPVDPINQWHVMTRSMNTNGAYAMYLNNVLQTNRTGTYLNTNWVDTPSIGYTSIIPPNDIYYFLGYVAETLMYQTNFNDLDRKQVFDFLNNKYGMVPTKPTNSIAAYWRMDEASGASRADAVGSSTLANNGTVGQAAGVITNSATFSAGNYLSIADNAALSMGTGQIFTIASWVYLSATNVHQYAISKWGADTAHGEYILRHDGVTYNRFRFITSDGSTATGVNADTPIPDPNTWYFVICWYDGMRNCIQVNNGTIYVSAAATGAQDLNNAFEVGADTGLGQSFAGRIDEVGIWKRVLTAPERASLYNGGNGRTYPF